MGLVSWLGFVRGKHCKIHAAACCCLLPLSAFLRLSLALEACRQADGLLIFGARSDGFLCFLFERGEDARELLLVAFFILL